MSTNPAPDPTTSQLNDSNTEAEAQKQRSRTVRDYIDYRTTEDLAASEDTTYAAALALLDGE